MCRILVTYNGKKITSFKCPADKIEEGLAYLRMKYYNCLLTIC